MTQSGRRKCCPLHFRNAFKSRIVMTGNGNIQEFRSNIKIGVFFTSLFLCNGASSQDRCEEYPDFALTPPAVNREPGPDYAEWTRSYQGMPSIERMQNGRLWAAWTSGGINEGPDNYVVLVTSTDDGRSWSRPIMTIDPSGNISAFVPILWRDPTDRLWVFWNQGYGAWWDGRGGAWAVTAENAKFVQSTVGQGQENCRRLAR